jgi:hypothetical protein
MVCECNEEANYDSQETTLAKSLDQKHRSTHIQTLLSYLALFPKLSAVLAISTR